MTRLFGVALVAAFFIVHPAAAETVVSDGRISLAPVFDYAFNTLLVVIPPVVTVVAVRLVNKWFGVKLDESASAALQLALAKGTQFGVAKLREVTKEFDSFAVKNQLAETVADYAIARVPDAIERFGLTPDKLREMALARIEEALPAKA